MASVQANGITIEYEEQGSGEPLLLVMGLGRQLTDWPQEFVDMLSGQGFRVIRHDNRDIGLSTEIDAPAPTNTQLVKTIASRKRGKAAYHLTDMAADAIGLLDALDIESAHVVGVSMGGMIVQTMAIEHPSRVKSMTSIMSHAGSRVAGRPKPRMVRLLPSRDGLTPEIEIERTVELFRAISGPTFDENEIREMAQASVGRSFRPGGVARQTASILASPDRTADLATVSAPTLVIHGMLDPLVQPSGGIATAKAVPGSRLLMFNDMGHDLPPTRWQEMVDAISLNTTRAS